MKGLLSKLGLCNISLMEKGSLKERVFGEVNVFVSSILAKLWCRYQVGKASCSVANREEVINRIWPGDQWKSSLGHVLDLKWHFENFHLNFITKYLLKDSNIATSTFSSVFLRNTFISAFQQCVVLLNDKITVIVNLQYRKCFLYWCWKEKEWKYYFIRVF